mgnify:CR=1 FL=1
MNLLENYNLAEVELYSKIEKILELRVGYNLHVQGFTATKDSVTASIYYYDSANHYFSKDFELRIEDFEC